jgi:hypothetical protein
VNAVWTVLVQVKVAVTVFGAAAVSASSVIVSAAVFVPVMTSPLSGCTVGVPKKIPALLVVAAKIALPLPAGESSVYVATTV